MKFIESLKNILGGAPKTEVIEGIPEEMRRLLEEAKASGEPFREGPYFDAAEPDMDLQWENLIWPILKERNIDYHCVLDFAAGYGWNSVKLRQYADRIIIVDINQESIDACKERFKGDDRFVYIKTNGISLTGIRNEDVTFIYSFDSMVHFDSDVVREYLKEFYRVLKPGGYGFCHHSNYTDNPTGDFTKSAHWRNFMSKELFAHYCAKEGLTIVEQRVIDWSVEKLDCLSLFCKSED